MNGLIMTDWHRSDDEIIGHLLIDTWSLITGRVLRSDVPPQELSADELIEFWADDLPRECICLRKSGQPINLKPFTQYDCGILVIL